MKMPYQKPTPARIVMVRSVLQGPEWPAIVLNAYGASGCIVDVSIFRPQGVEFASSVYPQVEGSVGWRWPPREGA